MMVMMVLPVLMRSKVEMTIAMKIMITMRITKKNWGRKGERGEVEEEER